MRDRKAIKFGMTEPFMLDPTMIELYGFTPGKTFEEEFSIVSWENIVFNLISFAFWLHEMIVINNANNSRPQNLPNFQSTILNFHDGLQLIWKNDQWQYDLTNVANGEERKIIDRCAVLESQDGELVVKVATDNGGDLGPINVDQEARLLSYIRQMKVPGVSIRLVNTVGDLIKTTITVYADPQIIDMSTGKLLNTTEEIFPVKDAVTTYLSELEFNGAFVKDLFKDRIRNAQGIKLVTINEMKWKYAAFPFVDFGEWKIPEAGYIKILPEDLIINYLPDVLVSN